MSLIDNIENVVFASSVPTDLILGTYTGSISSPAPAASPFTKTSTSVTITTNIPEKTFFQGIFSIDSGTTWLDFNAQIPNTTNPAVVALQTQMLYGRSTVGGLVLTADNYSYFNGSTTTSAAYIFLYKVVIFARPGQGDITPQPVVQALNFDTRLNYGKIAVDNSGSFSISTTSGTFTIPHNLGYIPKIRHYIDNFSFASSTTSLYDFGYFSSSFKIFNCSIDTTNVYYFFDNSLGVGNMTGTLYTRVYYGETF